MREPDGRGAAFKLVIAISVLASVKRVLLILDAYCVAAVSSFRTN